MKRSLRWRSAAAVGAFALTLAACGDDGSETTADETESPAATEEPTEEPTEGEVAIDRPGRDEILNLGYILPESGPLAFLGAPQIQGVRMAVEDINAAGGVNGSDVTLETGDEAGDAPQAREAAARLINGGVDAIVGAAASGMSQEIIQLLFDNQIVQCSASNTSPDFSQQDNNGYYHRTVPPDQAVAPIIADTVVNDGATNVAVAARADDYGVALGDLVEDSVQSLGASVATRVNYDPNTTDFSAEVSEITGANPDAVVLVSFNEGATLIRQLIEAGVPANQIYGSDGLFGPTLTTDVNPDNPGFISGMKVIGAAGGAEFNERLNQRLPEDEKGNFIYGGQAYDCAVVIALAAASSNSVDPEVFNDPVTAVTREGTECTSVADCFELIEQGEDIDYNGASGPLENEGTDPTVGRYAIGQFQDDGSLQITGDQDIDLSEVQ